MIKSKFFVRSDVDDNNIFREFDNEIDATSYAVGLSPEDEWYVVEVLADVNDDGEIAKELDSEVILTPDDLPNADDAFGIDDWQYPGADEMTDEDETASEAEASDDKASNLREAIDTLEESETDVECKECFELFPKIDCIKTDAGYLCPKCYSRLACAPFSHELAGCPAPDGFMDEFPEPHKFEDDEEEPNAELEDANVEFHDIQVSAETEDGSSDDSDEGQIDENFKGTPEIRTTHLEYMDENPADGKAVLPDNLKEHVQDRPASIKDATKIQGADNAIIKCQSEHKIIAHSEDEKPLDCKMEKPALEKPLSGDYIDVKLMEGSREKLLAFAKSLPDVVNVSDDALDEGAISWLKDKIDGAQIKRAYDGDEATKGYNIFINDGSGWKNTPEEFGGETHIASFDDATKKAEKLSTLTSKGVKAAAIKSIKDGKTLIVYKNGKQMANNLNDVSKQNKRDEKDIRTAVALGWETATQNDETPAADESGSEHDELENTVASDAKPDKRDNTKLNKARAEYKKLAKALEILHVDPKILRTEDGHVTKEFQELRKALFEDACTEEHITESATKGAPEADEVDPEEAKLEAHTMLNDLVADEIEAINGYEAAKGTLLDKPIEHKEAIISTIDHIKDEEQEHIDELIDAARKIPFENPENADEKAASHIEEASSAETRAFKHGGKDLDDLIQGKAIARIKDPKARTAAIAAAKAGRPDAVKDFTGDRKEDQAIASFDKKAKAMLAAGVQDDDLYEDLHKNEEAIIAELARQGVETGMIFDESDYALFAKACKEAGVEPSEELFKRYFKCVDDLVGIKEESLEWTITKDLADDRTPKLEKAEEYAEPVDGDEVRKYEKAIAQ